MVQSLIQSKKGNKRTFVLEVIGEVGGVGQNLKNWGEGRQ